MNCRAIVYCLWSKQRSRCCQRRLVILAILFGLLGWCKVVIILRHEMYHEARQRSEQQSLEKKMNAPQLTMLSHYNTSDFSQQKLTRVIPSQYIRKNKRGKIVMNELTHLSLQSVRQNVQNDDLVLRQADQAAEMRSSEDINQQYHDKQPILDLFRQAGIHQIDHQVVFMLPTAAQVAKLYGPSTLTNTSTNMRVLGWDTCATFRSMTKTRQGYLGVAGLFNTGTNALLYYLRANLAMPIQNETNISASDPAVLHHGGILTQVPWHKHWFSRLRHVNTVTLHKDVPKNAVMPIVIIRDPFTWMQSMCRAPYLVKFSPNYRHFCPRLTRSVRNNLDATVQIPDMFPFVNASTEPNNNSLPSWPTLLHLWKDWYADYVYSQQPFLMIRWEDLLFRPQQVIELIRTCTGAIPTYLVNASTVPTTTASSSSSSSVMAPFVYVVDPAKWEHVRFLGPQSNWPTAMIKHANAQRRLRTLTHSDLRLARDILLSHEDGTNTQNNTTRKLETISLAEYFQYQVPNDEEGFMETNRR